MIKVPWSDQGHQPLVEGMKTTPDARLRSRCQAVLMAARGRPHGHMAEDLAVRVRTLQRWLHRDHQPGLGGLESRWAPGRAPKIPTAIAPELRDGVRQGPAGCGLDRAHWTSEELAIDLDPVKGLTVSATTRRTCCPRHGVRPDRPTSQDLKANPAQQEIARHDLQALKNSRGGGTGLAQPR